MTSTDESGQLHGEPEGRTGENDDTVMSEAQAVLDNLLDVVKSEREGILSLAHEQGERALAQARAQAERDAARIRDDARVTKEQFVDEGRREAEGIVGDARRIADREKRAALDIVSGALDHLAEVETLRRQLEEIAITLRDSLRPSLGEPTGRAMADDPSGRDAGVSGYVEVDPAAILTLAEELGNQECRDVLETFLAEMTSQLDELARALIAEADESKLISRMLHNLSSGCATVGARSLARWCGSLTVAMLGDRLEELTRRAEVVRAEVIRVRDTELLT